MSWFKKLESDLDLILFERNNFDPSNPFSKLVVDEEEEFVAETNEEPIENDSTNSSSSLSER